MKRIGFMNILENLYKHKYPNLNGKNFKYPELERLSDILKHSTKVLISTTQIGK